MSVVVVYVYSACKRAIDAAEANAPIMKIAIRASFKSKRVSRSHVKS